MTDTTVQPNHPSPEETIRVALLVEYCGASFCGSQFQPDQPTVQQAMQQALADLNLQTSAVSFASRTDAGVNSLGQVAHFDIAANGLDNVANLAAALNARLPETVSVRDVRVNVPGSFHSRREAGCKWYRYRIYNAGNRSVWANRTAATHYRTPLDAEAMQQAARLLLGRHEFTSFKDTDTNVTDDWCEIRHINVARDGDFINFDIVADRFLYKMVRNLAGQLMAIGNAQAPQAPESILEVLEARDRSRAAATARPEGLMLMAIQYPAPYDFFAADPSVRQLETLLKKTRMESLQNENLFRKAS